MQDSYRLHRERRSKRRLVPLLLCIAVLALAAVGLFWMGTSRPTGEIRGLPPVLGTETAVSLTLRAPRAGLANWQAYVRDHDGKRLVLQEENIPRGSIFGAGVQNRAVDLLLDPVALDLAEGEAEIILQASSHAPLSWLANSGPVATSTVVVDRTPPRLRLRHSPRRILQGGTGLVVYEVSPDAVISGVDSAGTLFPGDGAHFTDRETRAALYTAPWNATDRHMLRVFAEDAAGNREVLEIPTKIRRRDARAETIRVSDRFLEHTVHPLLLANGHSVPDDPVAAYLAINRELRHASETRLREILSESGTGKLLVEQRLRQQPGSQVGSRFAEHRTYTYSGRPIDQQTHLGYDLASVREAPVQAAAEGQVVWVGDLGIYGNVVVLDHGLGLSTLYAHLSSVSVERGATVAHQGVLGRSGQTGLASGDHLHFSVTLRGHHVDPIEWWDESWVEREIFAPLAQAGGESLGTKTRKGAR